MGINRFKTCRGLRGLLSRVDYYWNNANYVFIYLFIFCEAFPFKRFPSRVTQMHLYHAKNLSKQLILMEQDQFLCQCEAAISIQQQPLQADWQRFSGFGKCQRENQENRGPLSTVYIFLYIFKLRFNLHPHLSFDSFLLTHGKIKNCCCGSFVGKSGCQSPPGPS